MTSQISDKLIALKIEKARMSREESKLILDKGITMYLLFLLISVVGLITRYLELTNFLILICMAFLVLIVTSLPYLRNITIEKKDFDNLIKEVEENK